MHLLSEVEYTKSSFSKHHHTSQDKPVYISHFLENYTHTYTWFWHLSYWDFFYHNKNFEVIYFIITKNEQEQSSKQGNKKIESLIR